MQLTHFATLQKSCFHQLVLNQQPSDIMSSRKRRQPYGSSLSQNSVSQPSKKRRRISSGSEPNLSSSTTTYSHHHNNNHNNHNHNHTHNYLINNLIALRNDDKISDVTFVLKKEVEPHELDNDGNNGSLSDDEQHEDHPHDKSKKVKIYKFKCIKALFAANSEVFKNLLYGDFQEGKEKNPEIELSSITLTAFEYIRDLFYHFNPILTDQIVLEVGIAAHKYFIYPLMNECINYLRNISNINKWYKVIIEIQEKGYMRYLSIEIYLKALIDENYMINNCSVLIFNDLKRLYSLNIEILNRLIKSDNINLSEELIWHKSVGYALYHTKLKYKHIKKLPAKIDKLIAKHLNEPKKIFEQLAKTTI